MVLVNGGLHSLYAHEQILKTSSLKPLVRFWNNFTEMFFGWPFSKIVGEIWSVNKHGICEWGLLALYGHKEILVNSSPKAQKKKWPWYSQKFRWAIQGHPLFNDVVTSYKGGVIYGNTVEDGAFTLMGEEQITCIKIEARWRTKHICNSKSYNICKNLIMSLATSTFVERTLSATNVENV